MSWLQGYGWVVGFIVAVALVLGGLAWWTVRRRPATPVPGAAARRQVDVTFAAAVLVTLAVGLVAVFWLLAQAEQVPVGQDRATAQSDAIKTGATIVLGTGGAAYLLLAYRRQRLEEVDTRERRITELFTKAVEELGHEKAPVRLGVLYSLERLAQNNPEHRQTVVDVFCAYLRMPYRLPTQGEPGTEQVKEAATTEDENKALHRVVGRDPAEEELQVRQTAQRRLAAHLKLPPGLSAAAQRRQPSPRRAFWPGISLDLTGAALVDFHFEQVSIVQGWFDRATFQGDANFDKTTFQREAGFEGATFQGDDAGFDGATFQARAEFDGATFQGDATFARATFRGYTWFVGATFRGFADFDRVTFRDFANFDASTFEGEAGFDKATSTIGKRGIGIANARVLHVDNPKLNKYRVWPDGWSVRPDPARGIGNSCGSPVPHDHAATSLVSSSGASLGRSTSLPLSNLAPARTSATRCGPLTARHRCSAASSSLNTIANPACLLPGPLVTRVRARTGENVLSMGLVTGMKGRGCRLRPRIGCWWSPVS
jgi:hypothetical protein